MSRKNAPAGLSRLIERVAIEAGVTQTLARKVVQLFIESVKDETWAKGRMNLVGFARFAVRQGKARRCRNPQTGESITLPGREFVTARAAKVWRTK